MRGLKTTQINEKLEPKQRDPEFTPDDPDPDPDPSPLQFLPPLHSPLPPRPLFSHPSAPELLPDNEPSPAFASVSAPAVLPSEQRPRQPPKDLRYQALLLHKSMKAMWNTKAKINKPKLSSLKIEEARPVGLDFSFHLFKNLTGSYPTASDLILIRNSIDSFLQDGSFLDNLPFLETQSVNPLPSPIPSLASASFSSSSDQGSDPLCASWSPDRSPDPPSPPILSSSSSDRLLDLNAYHSLLEKQILPVVKVALQARSSSVMSKFRTPLSASSSSPTLFTSSGPLSISSSSLSSTSLSSNPNPPSSNRNSGKKKKIEIYSHAEQGPRPAMEDDYLIIEDLFPFKRSSSTTLQSLPIGRHDNEPQILASTTQDENKRLNEETEENHQSIGFLGVYDGHNGDQAAEYSRIHLHYNILNSPFFGTDIEKAIRDGYQRTDTGFHQTAAIHKFECGTTALGVFLLDDRIVVTNVGDTSCALACSDGSVTELSVRHSPENPDEKQRIEKSGGVVIWYGRWRVNGQLAVSRSIGDVHLKNLVISEPSVVDRKITDDHEEFLIMATDGLWDVFTPEDAVVFVKKLLSEKQPRKEIPRLLCLEAIERKTGDNTTIIMVWF